MSDLVTLCKALIKNASDEGVLQNVTKQLIWNG